MNYKITERIDSDYAIELYNKLDLLELGELANNIRREKHPDNIVTFVIDRNINYTNICVCKCKFCAFYRSKDEPDAYVIDKETLKRKIDETKELNGTQILLQGGLHPDFDIEFYEDMLKFIKEQGVWVHGFSPPEIYHIAKVSNLTIEDTLKRLIEAGLDSIPGGGAELLVDSERAKISPNKINSSQWLEVMRVAHELGLRTTATMMFKKNDPIELIVEHLEKVRNLQDITGGFTAFIPWPFQPDNTELGGEHVTAYEYLKILALSRIYFDNIDNIQVSWVTQGPKIGQIGLYFGGNDFGSLMIEENVVAACGATYRISLDEIIHYIKRAGFIPAQRDMQYNILRIFDE
ncbi:dehypoxanthine futalosine cyclase [Deferribacter thermophilus]|uniref:cyclic dehypoxanthinyl futalosine synthase n=1 Tax=Deferribacter thermophilus TaxID=53573 RepID=UPI003C1D6FB7